MNTCPACSKTVEPNQLACPHCGISLHPGTATAGPASAGGGSGLSIAAIVVIAVIGIVVLVVCLGGGLFFFRLAATPLPAPATPVTAPLPPAAPTAVGVAPPVEIPVDGAAAETAEDQTPAEQP
jgi:hypothetical protein